jgi:cytochrome oxidase assembly protein ShyY1
VYRFALAPRWLAFHLLVVVVALGCVRLGAWQLDRWDARRGHNAVIQDNAARPPVDIATVVGTTGDGERVDGADEWRTVTATGRYDASRTTLVRNRTYDGAKGFEVLVPLVTAAGTALVVDRGWVPAGRSATELIDVPEVPAGEVRVSGRLRAGEHADAAHRRQATDLPQRSVVRIDVPFLAEDLPYPAYNGFVELTEEAPTPAEAPKLLPLPELGTGPHLAYACQWWVFAIIAVVGWFVLLRREGRDLQAAALRSTRTPVGAGAAP